MSYTVRILPADQVTLEWLADRGYDGGFLDVATLAESPEDGATCYVYTLDEPAAWAFKDTTDEDQAFLTCNGSDTLAEALLRLLDRIV